MVSSVMLDCRYSSIFPQLCLTILVCILRVSQFITICLSYFVSFVVKSIFLKLFDSYFVQVCGHELMAHRAVLACCSPYLFEIFNSDVEPHGVSHVTFEDLDPEAVEILLNYAYTAKLVAH